MFLSLLLVLAGCGREEGHEPSSPAEMYALSQSLLKPGVEGKEPDYAGAMEWLRRAAEGGYMPAQRDMGGIYLEGGRLVGKDGRAAYEWFSRAAQQGSMESEYYLGYILCEGLGMERNIPEGMKHWERAAEGGVPRAQFDWGRLLAGKEGRLEEGMRWLRKAAASADVLVVAEASCALGNLCYKGGPGLAPDEKAAMQWYARAARAGDARAQLVYALALLEGKGMERDEAQGMAFLRLSAGQDYPAAIAMLINRLRNGEGADQKKEEIRAWEERLERFRVPTRRGEEEQKPSEI